MDNKELIEASKDNLNRILSFFPRVNNLVSVLLAIELSLMAVFTANIPPLKTIQFNDLIALGFFLLIILSLYHLYKCAFPNLEGGYTSLIYFREIASKSKLRYAEKFKAQTEEFYLEDLIEQVWRNSEILKEKYHHIKYAFIFLLLSLIFWLPVLIKFISNNTEKLLN